MDQLGSKYSMMHSGSQSILICCLVDTGVRCPRRAGNASYNKRVQRVVLQRKLRLEQDRNADHSYICDTHKAVIQQSRTPFMTGVRVGGASGSQEQVARISSARAPVNSGAQMQSRVGASVSARLNSQNQQVGGTAMRKRARIQHGYATPPTASASAFSSGNNSQVDGGVFEQREAGVGASFVDLQQVNLAVLRRYKKTYKVAGAKPGASKAHFAEVIAKHFRSLQYGNEFEVVKSFIFNVRTNRNRLDPPAFGTLGGTQSGSGAESVSGGGLQSYVSGSSSYVGTS